MATKTEEDTDVISFQRNRSVSDPKPCLDSLSLPGDSLDGPGGDSSSWASGTSTTQRQGKMSKNDARKNGDSKSLHSGASPPVERKSKLSALGKIFRPWKWKRKKKSERFEKTAIEIERKISMRTSREELIRKGVIKEPDGSPAQVPKIGTLKEQQEEENMAECQQDKPQVKEIDFKTPTPVSTSEQVTSDGLNRSAGTSDSVTVTSSTTSSSKWLPAAASPVITLTTQAQIASPVVTNTVMSTTVHDRPVIVPAKCPSPTPQRPYEPLQHPPPPKYTEALAQVAPEMLGGARFQSVSFQAVGDGFKRVAVVVPQDSDEEDEVEEDVEDDGSGDDGIDPAMIPPQSPYQAVLASEPDLNKRPHKSALKKMNVLGGGTSSWTTRPLDTSPTATSNTLPALVASQTEGRLSPQPAFKPVPRPRVTVQAVGDNDSDKENSGPQIPNTPDYDTVPGGSDSEDEDVQYNDDFDPNSLAGKVARNDSLARFLESRPSKNELVAKNIIPSQTENEKKELRDAIGSQLIRRLSLRPTQEELENRNILHQQTLAEAKAEKERRKRYLLRKLSFRPSIEELRERKIIDFNDYVEVTDAREYDRRAEKPWTKLTPRDKAAIRKELNEFKSKEMDVHEESRHFTRFHKP